MSALGLSTRANVVAVPANVDTGMAGRAAFVHKRRQTLLLFDCYGGVITIEEIIEGAGVTSVASKTSIAFVKFSKVTRSASSGKAAFNQSTYCGNRLESSDELIRCVGHFDSGLHWYVGLGLEVFAAPLELRDVEDSIQIVGALHGPFCQPWPIEVSRLSSPPVAKLWHEFHEKTPDAETHGSKNIALPRAVFVGVIGLLLTAGVMDGKGLKVARAVS